jgi:uncharacterized oligopeptide transporter (OPT) family protein
MAPPSAPALDGDAARDAAPRPELTWRALVTGCGIGALLAVVNTYAGLKTGFCDTGNIIAATLGFALFASLGRLLRVPYSPLENNVTVSAAISVSAMPATAGLLGAIPGLTLMGQHVSGWAIAAWGLVLALLGVFIALPLRRTMIVEEGLPFPTGIATAEVIAAMHAAGREALARARALLIAGGGAMLLTWFRDARPALLPQASYLPFRIGGVPASALTLGVSWSPMMMGFGAMIGPHAALSLVLGSVIAWGVLAPCLVGARIVTQTEYPAFVAWLTWPGVALMLGAAVVALVGQRRAFAQVIGDLRGLGRGPAGLRAAAAAGVLLVGLVLVVGWLGFGLPPLGALLAIALAVVLGVVCARAAGQTDFAPLAQMGQLTQALAAVVVPTQAAANVVTASVVAGSATHTTQMLYAWRTTHNLGGSPRRQIVALVVGALVGACVVMPVYTLLVRAHGLGSQALPAPFGVVWKTVAEAVTGGGSAFPRYATLASAIAFAVGLVLEAATRGRAARYVPSALAMGVGFVAPASYGIAIALGAGLFALWRAVRPAPAERLGSSVTAGAVAGEAVMGVLIAVLLATGLLGSR